MLGFSLKWIDVTTLVELASEHHFVEELYNFCFWMARWSTKLHQLQIRLELNSCILKLLLSPEHVFTLKSQVISVIHELESINFTSVCRNIYNFSVDTRISAELSPLSLLFLATFHKSFKSILWIQRSCGSAMENQCSTSSFLGLMKTFLQL